MAFMRILCDVAYDFKCTEQSAKYGWMTAVVRNALFKYLCRETTSLLWLEIIAVVLMKI